MYYPKLPIRFALLLLWLLPFYSSQAQSYQSVDDVPNPTTTVNGYVSNPNGILSDDDVFYLNSMITQLKDSTGVETAVVVIHDFNADDDDFDFAKDLFRKWGIGKKGANNGLLLFVAVDRRKYRFITGDGLEGLLPDADLRQIGDQYLVPKFREKEYGQGIKDAITFINTYLQTPENQRELSALLRKNPPTAKAWQVPVVLALLFIAMFVLLRRFLKKQVPNIGKGYAKKPTTYDNAGTIILVTLFLGGLAFIFIVGFAAGLRWFTTISVDALPVIVYVLITILFMVSYLDKVSTLRKVNRDDENFTSAVSAFFKKSWWTIILSPLIIIVFLIEYFRRQEQQKKLQPPVDTLGQPMKRVNRNDNPTGKPYLTAGQLKEEELGVYSYYIWLGSNNEQKIIPYPCNDFSRYANCPECGFKTLDKPKLITLVPATYSSTGKGQEIRICGNCKLRQIVREVTIPIKSRNDSSGSSSSSSSRSSSSSSSSFGGGSTSGGGAGGSW